MHDLFHAAMEGISFQKGGALGKDIEVVIRELQTKSKPGQQDLNALKLGDIIKHHTNISTKIEIMPDFNACVFIPEIDRNNVLINKARKEMMSNIESRRIIAHKGFFDGWVDLRDGTVHGDFQKMFMIIRIGTPLLKKGSRLKPEETTAVILHEIGHMLTYFEMLGRFSKTNYVMNEATKAMMEAQTAEQRVKVFEEIENHYGEQVSHKERLSKMPESKEFYQTVFLSIAARQAQNQTGVNIYDIRSFEQLADNYAARQGYGRPLATALDKIYRMAGDKTYRSGALHVLWSVIKFIGFIFLASRNIFLLITLFSNPLISEYDKPLQRIQKIRNQLTAALKEEDITSSDRKDILKDIEITDGLLAEMKDRDDVYEFIWKNIFPWGRKQQAEVDFQEDLEKLLNNRLFEAAATLQK